MDAESEPQSRYYHRHHGGSIVWAVILIAAGAVFLLNNFGLLPWSIWDTMWRFWPVFLIIWGLQVIFGRSWLASLLIGLLSLVLVAFFLVSVVSAANPSFNTWMNDHMNWIPDSSWITNPSFDCD